MLFLLPPIEQTPYWSCLDQNVVRLERSGEAPRDVAYAAIAACQAEAPQWGPKLMGKVRARLVVKLSARVVEIRAQSHP